jgi:hypothetical protein
MTIPVYADTTLSIADAVIASAVGI